MIAIITVMSFLSTACQHYVLFVSYHRVVASLTVVTGSQKDGIIFPKPHRGRAPRRPSVPDTDGEEGASCHVDLRTSLGESVLPHYVYLCVDEDPSAVTQLYARTGHSVPWNKQAVVPPSCDRVIRTGTGSTRKPVDVGFIVPVLFSWSGALLCSF